MLSNLLKNFHLFWLSSKGPDFLNLMWRRFVCSKETERIGNDIGERVTQTYVPALELLSRAASSVGTEGTTRKEWS